MFPATIAAFNHRTRPMNQPLSVPKAEPVAQQPDPVKPENDYGHGQRKAGEISLTGKPKDPTAELAKQILGS
jgi:hypothetical protein|eukprot:COSAG01_NODE_1646_length_9634_cov_27.152805_6_plen_72_part_00